MPGPRPAAGVTSSRHADVERGAQPVARPPRRAGSGTRCAASSAWLSVWPRLSAIRTPLVSCSSSEDEPPLGKGAPFDQLEQRRRHEARPRCPRIGRPTPAGRRSASSPSSPYFTASARAARRSSGDSSATSATSRMVAAGWWIAPSRFRPDAGQVDPALAADRGVDEAEGGDRHGDERDAAKPDGRRERRRLEQRVVADGDSGSRRSIGAREPAEQGLVLVQALGRLAVGELLDVDGHARRRRGSADGRLRARARLRGEVSTTQRLAASRPRTCSRLWARIPSPSSISPPWMSARRTSVPLSGAAAPAAASTAAIVSASEPERIDPDARGVVRRDRSRRCSVNKRPQVAMDADVLATGRSQAFDQAGRRDVEPDHMPAAVQAVADGRVGDDAIGGDDRARPGPVPGIRSRAGARHGIGRAAPGSPVRSMNRAWCRSARAGRRSGRQIRGHRPARLPSPAICRLEHARMRGVRRMVPLDPDRVVP